MKNKIKNILLVMLVAVISGSLSSVLTTNTISTNKLLGSVSHSDYLDSSKVTYLDSNVQDSIDNLYTKASDYTEIRNMIYPVGSIYISVTDDTVAKVQARFGGEWESFGEGRTIIGAGTGTDSNNTSKTFEVNSTGGEYTHKLTIDEMPHIYGEVSFHGSLDSDIILASSGVFSLSHKYDGYSRPTHIKDSDGIPSYGVFAIDFGNDKYHNNIQPYITVYMYKRIS